MLMDLNMEVPRPWLMASRVQQGKPPDVSWNDTNKSFAATTTNNVDHDIDKSPHTISSNPRLPRLSPSAVGSIIGMMTGAAEDNHHHEEDEKKTNDAASPSAILAGQSLALMEGLQSIKAGDKMVDTSDGKTIGQILSPPEPGTNVVLAQVRLDRVGLIGDGVWTHTNKVKVGDFGELRYLPYLPLWWPEIDRESGKAKVVNNSLEDDEEELE
jgi:transferase CAF17, mitochondrial